MESTPENAFAAFTFQRGDRVIIHRSRSPALKPGLFHEPVVWLVVWRILAEGQDGHCQRSYCCRAVSNSLTQAGTVGYSEFTEEELDLLPPTPPV